MRIGILTFHDTTNFGAALQAHALVAALRDLGADAEVIDYRNAKMTARKSTQQPLRSIRTLRGWLRSVALRVAISSKERAFVDFQRAYLPMSTRTYTDSRALRESASMYDLVILGSDQVWNYEITGLDPTYFLDFVEDRDKTATYASSFGLDSIPPDVHQQYATGLGSISRISVREKLAVDLVRLVSQREAQLHADPVFLREADQWRSIAKERSKHSGKPTYVSYFLGAELRRSAEPLIAKSRLSNFRQVKLAGGIQFSDLVRPDVDVRFKRGPRDFITSIDSAQFVLTGSFHATAMSIILDRPFGVLLKGDPGKDARITGLLDQFGLMDRVVESPDQLVFERPSESRDTTRILTKLREDGLGYLSELIAP